MAQFIKTIKSKNNIINNVNLNRIVSITDENRTSSFFIIPIVLNTSNDLIREIRKIKITFYNRSILENEYGNVITSQTPDSFKQFKLSDEGYLNLNNNVVTNLLDNYNIRSSQNVDNSHIYESLFSINRISTNPNFLSITGTGNITVNSPNEFETFDDLPAGTVTYYTLINSTQTDYILDEKPSSFRIYFLDENEKIIDNSEFLYNVDFHSIHNNALVSNDNSISSLNINNSITNSSIAYMSQLEGFTSDFFTLTTNLLSHENLIRDVISMSIRYISDSGTIKTIESEQPLSGFSYIAVGKNQNEFAFDDFIYKILYDKLILENQNYKFEIVIVLLLTNQAESNEYQETYVKTFNFLPESHFVTEIANTALLRQNDFKNFLKNKFLFEQNFELLQNNSIFCTINLSHSNSNFLELFSINGVYLNGILVDRLYSDASQSIDSILRNDSLKIINMTQDNNQINFYFNVYRFEDIYNIEIELFIEQLNFTYRLDAFSLMNMLEKRNSIVELNKFFKDNTFIDNITFNNNLSPESEKRMFSIEEIQVRNLFELSTIAYNYGYVDSTNTNGDVFNFLKNCFIKVENFNSISRINYKTSNITYMFFEDLFDMTNFSNNTLVSNTSGLDTITKNNDFFNISALENDNSIKTRLKNFFNNSSTRSKLINISLVTNILVKNKIIISVIPIHYIIAKYKGNGLDNLNNPIINSNVNLITESIDSEKKELSKSFIDLFFKQNKRLNFNKLERFVRIFMNANLETSAIDYQEIIEYIYKFNLENTPNIFTLETKLSNNTITSTLSNINNFSFLSEKSDFLAENIEGKAFNINLDSNNFKIKNIPISIKFNQISIVNSNIEEYAFNDLTLFVNNALDSLSIDISALSNYYDDSSIIRINPYIKVLPLFLITNQDKNISSDIVENEQIFDIVNYNNKDYLIYNQNYISDPQNRLAFRNYNIGIDSSFISIEKNQDKFEINITPSGTNLDIASNRLNYNTIRSYIDFCNRNDIIYLDKIILRVILSFSIMNSDNKNDFYTTGMNYELNKINLNNSKVLINNFKSMTKTNTI